MVFYLITVFITIAFVIWIRAFLFPDTINEPHIPDSLSKDDLLMDGNRLLYNYEGNWYEAISKHGDIVYIYDKFSDKIIRVPYIKGE